MEDGKKRRGIIYFKFLLISLKFPLKNLQIPSPIREAAFSERERGE